MINYLINQIIIVFDKWSDYGYFIEEYCHCQLGKTNTPYQPMIFSCVTAHSCTYTSEHVPTHTYTQFCKSVFTIKFGDCCCCCCFLFVCFSETGSHYVVLAVLELNVYSSLVLNLQSSICLCLLSARTKSVCHHA